MQVARVSLNPAKAKATKIQSRDTKKEVKEVRPTFTPTGNTDKPTTLVKQPVPLKQGIPAHPNEAAKTSSHKVVTFVRSSKFRHIEGHLSSQRSSIEKLPPLSNTVPGDSNAFQANRERVAVVLSMAGGQVAVLEVG